MIYSPQVLVIVLLGHAVDILQGGLAGDCQFVANLVIGYVAQLMAIGAQQEDVVGCVRFHDHGEVFAILAWHNILPYVGISTATDYATILFGLLVIATYIADSTTRWLKA